MPGKAAIDTAMWDLRGKLLGLPAARLLDEPQGADLATAALAELAATIDPGHFLGTGCFIGPHMPFSYQKAGPSGPGPQFDDGTLQRGNAPGLGVDVDDDVLGPPLFQLAR